MRIPLIAAIAFSVLSAASCTSRSLQHGLPDGSTVTVVAVNDSTFFVTRTAAGAERAEPYLARLFRSGLSSEDDTPHGTVLQKQDVQCKKSKTDTTLSISTGAISAVLDLRSDSLAFTLLGGREIAREPLCDSLDFLYLDPEPYGVVKADGGYYFMAARDIDGVIGAYRSLCGKAEIPSRGILESLSYMDRDSSSREEILRYDHARDRASGLSRRTFFSHSRFCGLQRYGAYLEKVARDTSGASIFSHLQSGLECSRAGLPYWGIDLGADGIADSVYMASEIDIRMHQFAVFAPLYCPKPGAADVTAEIAATNRIRRMLQPYIYSMAAAAYFENYTPARPLSWDFPDDERAVPVQDQYMFGNALMVCPVYRKRARSRLVYLPAGTNWYDVYRQRFVKGGTSVVADAPLGHIPVYSRASSMMALISQDDVMTIVVSPGGDSDYTLYQDDGNSYSYKKGAWHRIRFHWDDRKRILSISQREGSNKVPFKAFPLCVRVIGLSPRILVCDGTAAQVNFGGGSR